MKTIVNYSTKQRGYFRQSLYVDVQWNNLTFKYMYVRDVSTNVHEGMNILLGEDAFYNEEKDIYTDADGNEYDKCYKTTVEALNDMIDIEKLPLEAFAIAYDDADGQRRYMTEYGGRFMNSEDNAKLFLTEEEIDLTDYEDGRLYIHPVH